MGGQQRSAMAPTCPQQDRVNIAHTCLRDLFSQTWVKYPWLCKTACSCLQTARGTGFDTHPREDTIPHLAHLIQPPGTGFSRLSWASGRGKREKNLSVAQLGVSEGKRTHNKVLLALLARQSRRQSYEPHVCTRHYFLFFTPPPPCSANTVWSTTLLKRMHSARKSSVWNPKDYLTFIYSVPYQCLSKSLRVLSFW